MNINVTKFYKLKQRVDFICKTILQNNLNSYLLNGPENKHIPVHASDVIYTSSKPK